MFCVIFINKQRNFVPLYCRFLSKKEKKSFQIILPSDVDIALASVYCLRATESVLRRTTAQLSCQLPPLRAEGSKNGGIVMELGFGRKRK